MTSRNFTGDDVISSASAQSLEAYTTDKNFRIEQPFEYYENQIQSIHPYDKPAISSLICIFELMSKKRSDLGFHH